MILTLPQKKTSKRRRHTASAYRSGLELSNSEYLKSLGVKGWSYESFKITYQKQPSKYTPDFLLPNGIIIETKGYFEPQDRTKHKLIKEQHPDLDIRFVFSNPHQKISKRSYTTYGKWCEQYGFMWAKQLIPEAWINEPKCEVRLKAVEQFNSKVKK